MDELELTGTLRKRSAQIITFAQAHNKSRSDRSHRGTAAPRWYPRRREAAVFPLLITEKQ